VSDEIPLLEPPILAEKHYAAPSVFDVANLMRDEGASYHYPPPARYSTLAPSLREQLNQSWEYQRVPRYAGSSWTTDAPFRETAQAIALARAEGIAAVEMEAAALYALAINTMATQGDDFEKGPDQGSLATLAVIAETMRCWQNRR
jgi:hypothetical protein